MGKRGPKPDPHAKQTVGIRVDKDTKYLMEKYGTTEIWRKLLKEIATLKADYDRGVWTPEQFIDLAGMKTAAVTGIPAKDESEDDTD